MTQFHENTWTDGRKTERKNGQGLFYTTLLATAQGPPRV